MSFRRNSRHGILSNFFFNVISLLRGIDLIMTRSHHDADMSWGTIRYISHGSLALTPGPAMPPCFVGSSLFRIALLFFHPSFYPSCVKLKSYYFKAWFWFLQSFSGHPFPNGLKVSSLVHIVFHMLQISIFLVITR